MADFERKSVIHLLPPCFVIAFAQRLLRNAGQLARIGPRLPSAVCLYPQNHSGVQEHQEAGRNVSIEVAGNLVASGRITPTSP